MNAAELVEALELPPASRVDRRVPKGLLVENGAPTAADKRRINEGIEECRWLATLKPTTISVPEYRDAQREYVEINVLFLSLRAGAKVGRLLELVHRAVPYPLVLISDGEDPTVSLAHKRWSQSEVGKTVLDGELLIGQGLACAGTEIERALGEHLALSRLPRAELYAVYQGWIDVLLAYQAARRTGRFELQVGPGRAQARAAALHECARLDSEGARLRAAAQKEKQIARRVELNLELKRIEAALTAAKDKL
ncbi:MAG TPA: DUF4391 domain-containing protein [Terriglobales bacterium]|nr:DUF4391 domain-containing protein [Terriglobales bacterium]